ncbi:type I DNA topoisomerase [Methylothermus subterraneus]
MAQRLVIVESPAKAKTIAKYLGSGFKVLASYGHVRDLLPKEGAVDPERDFAMKYAVIDKNKKHLQSIQQAAKQADVLYLATDPDREGEAISWHILELLDKKALAGKAVYRIVFHEITQRAIQEALNHPGQLSMDLVDAYKARRALDYLVGFNLSPLLWKKIRRGLSAGRVQSPALRMIVERELEIEQFQPKEYWTLEAQCQTADQPFTARLIQYQGDKLKQFSIANAQDALAIRENLLKSAQGELRVVRVEKKQRKRNPPPPFITSTLQQEAVRKLGFSAQRTMQIAQQLYEGIDLGGETVGLITYMRTDSTQLATEAVAEIRDLIASLFGQDNLPTTPRTFKTKAKNAQEAHEAIRPTSIHRLPQQVKPYLTLEQFRLYELIWKRTVACQMIHATLDTVVVDLACGAAANLFRATGSTVAHPGFLAVYEEGRDEEGGEHEAGLLPPMQEGQRVHLKDILAHQHFTEPPPRYTEASLVKALEEYGIGRPSTYASIISTLLLREYAVLENKRFKPTYLGRIVNQFLTEHFTRYVDYHFTADLEDQLDAISRGEKPWIGVLREFWMPFKRLVEEKEASVKRSEVTQTPLDERCPECGGQLSIRLGRNGHFIGCANFPECKYTRDLDAPEESLAAEETGPCPKCGGQLQVKTSRYGRFLGCSNYPKCRHIEPLEKPEDTGVLCPKCQAGTLLKRKSRSGKIFYACSTYPKCDYALWNPPVAEPCPQCGWPILTLKTTRRRGTEKVCPQKSCGFSQPLEEAPLAAEA